MLLSSVVFMHPSIYIYENVLLLLQVSSVDYHKTFGGWLEDKWKGQFKVRWIFCKDIPNSQLRHIILPNNENKPVTNSRDTQEVPFPQVCDEAATAVLVLSEDERRDHRIILLCYDAGEGGAEDFPFVSREKILAR